MRPIGIGSRSGTLRNTVVEASIESAVRSEANASPSSTAQESRYHMPSPPLVPAAVQRDDAVLNAFGFEGGHHVRALTKPAQLHGCRRVPGATAREDARLDRDFVGRLTDFLEIARRE